MPNPNPNPNQRSAGREPGNQNWCREHAPGPRVGPGSGEAGGTQCSGVVGPSHPHLQIQKDEAFPIRQRAGRPLRGPTMMTRTFRVRGTGFSNPRFAKPDENCLVGVPVAFTLREINQQRQERPRYLSTDQPDTQSRSLLSRSRVNRAVEAARRVGGGLIVAALNVGGLRSGAGAPTDAGGQRPAG